MTVRALRSVRARLLLMVTAVVLVAVVAVGWTSRRGTRVEFSQFVSKLETEVEGPTGGAASLLGDLEQLGAALQESFRSNEGWSDAGPILRGASEMLDGRTALVVSGDDQVVAASDDGLLGAVVEVAEDGGVQITGWAFSDAAAGVAANQTVAFRGPARPIRGRDGRQEGVLYVIPGLEQDTEMHLRDTLRAEDFLGSVDRWIVGAVVGVGLLALLATVLLSGRIVGPIEQLTEASKRMGRGDLAHRVEIETGDEIGDLARAFNSMAASLERNEQLRRNMVSDVAHELRTPLTNLRAQLEAVQDGLARPTPELIASLHEETMLLKHLVDDLQDLALVEARQLRLTVEALDVGVEVARAAELFGSRGSRDGGGNGPIAAATIFTDVEDGLPRAKGDLQRFRQVLRNLLDNAVEHGGGEIMVAARRRPQPPDAAVLPAAVAVPAAGYVEVTVSDSGPGISPEHTVNIFERFYRTDPSRQRATGGAGLGLAIVRQLVEAQAGYVWVESEPGRGSVFGFCLPAEGVASDVAS